MKRPDGFGQLRTNERETADWIDTVEAYAIDLEEELAEARAVLEKERSMATFTIQALNEWLEQARAVLRLIAECKTPRIVKLSPDGPVLHVTLDMLDMGGLEILAVPLGTSERIAKTLGATAPAPVPPPG